MKQTTVGIDSIEIERIKEIYINEGDIFLQKIFTPEEKDEILSRNINKFQTMAGKYAAKEAIYKAMSQYISLTYKQIEILSQKDGRPKVTLYIKQEELDKIYIDISITHDKTKALSIAYVTYTL